ncbi:MAG: hypothetical protein P1U40_02645 [Coxiellaceae bacterium]|nr:hypothetical protein [Coxiellaceae bacterium]
MQYVLPLVDDCHFACQHKEIDFMITKDGEPCLPIEVKLSDQQPSANWPILLKQIPTKHGIQIVVIAT